MENMKLTKIVATIGPASDTAVTIESLIKLGVNVFRFNTKHSTPEWHDERIKLVQKVANKMGETIGILLDLQGPEIRLETKDKENVDLKTGEELIIRQNFNLMDTKVIIPHVAIFKNLLTVGDELFIDDGYVETEVVAVTKDSIVVVAKNDCVIKHRKGVNLPGKNIDFPSLISNDLKQLDVNSVNKVDFVGLSFVRSARDIKILRAELLKRKMNAQIVAKIESRQALDNIDEIIEEADVVMVARGDLGIEVPIEQLAHWQREIITRCRLANKPVITATQMLESMINNPRPTRAEATDVAHAIFDGTDAIMLSGETAGGKYPVKTVETMAKIARWNEKNRPDTIDLKFVKDTGTYAICAAAVSIVKSKIEPKIKAIIVLTETGLTARTISRYRLGIPIFGLTSSQKTAEELSLSFGVKPIVVKFPTGQFTTAGDFFGKLIEKNLLNKDDSVLIIHGSHWQKSGLTNAIQITTV
ncbi:MAG: pyruvate kinase [Candidatus Shapirobacteria bacterium]